VNDSLRKLGYGQNDRVLIIHADDVGMCQATLSGLVDLFDFGLVSSAAVMVPCPWFQHAAAIGRDHPRLDLGVHLTLNSEWTPYRWGPISTRDPASGLLDEQGCFHRRPSATLEHADPQAVQAELHLQLRRALEAGLDVTHVDAHMLTAARPPFRPLYVEAALEQRLPLLLTNGSPDGSELADLMAADPPLAQRLAAHGAPLFDDLQSLPLDDPRDQLVLATKLIDGLRPGLTMLLLHPAQDTPELRALAPDWPSRVANYSVMLSSELRDHVRRSGVQVIGYRPLRELMRANA
jgi:predicted glycoside hydrolase/deacetylase ChbG (UPF0249 family)